MRVFICGSTFDEDFPTKEERESIVRAAKEIGGRLFHKRFSLIVGTDTAVSVDRHVVDGALEEAKAHARAIDVSVYYLKGTKPVPYAWLMDNPHVRVQPHEVDSDNWHVAHMQAVESCDCVLLLAGRDGTLVSGLTSMLLGIPFVPIASFGGKAHDVWRIAKHSPDRYFFGALDEGQVDALNHPWIPHKNVDVIVEYFRTLVASRRKARRRVEGSQAIALIGMLLGLFVFFLCLYKGTMSGSAVTRAFCLIAQFMSAAVAGAGLGIFTGHVVPRPSSSVGSLFRVLFSAGSGFIAWLLVPLVQFFADKDTSLLELTKGEFSHLTILSGAAGAYSGICTEIIVDKLLRFVEARFTAEGSRRDRDVDEAAPMTVT